MRSQVASDFLRESISVKFAVLIFDVQGQSIGTKNLIPLTSLVCLPLGVLKSPSIVA